MLRSIRRRANQTQAELAALANVPRTDVIKIEAGHVADVRLERTRRILAAAGGRARLTVWWNGALADRLLDERHAALGERALGVYLRWHWQSAVEVTFSEWGERGSIDLLTGHPPTKSAVVNEIKSELGSIEETNRLLDVKVRLAAKLVYERLGWRPGTVSRVLILPAEDSIRRAIARHGRTMDSAYPARSREVRAWIHQPRGTLRGLWFLSEVRNSDLIPR
ncbi:MAG: helix-turn-helix domain-containing protein [Chloroflexota bacterium]|nr:helix-turn-helix domain-containing protein [Chloroflexota bacterium]